MKLDTTLVLDPESLLSPGILKKGEVELQEIYDKRYPCLRCVKLRVNRKTSNLVSMCAAFTYFCFQWKENEGKVAPWAIQCFGFCGKETDWLDTQDEIHKYIMQKKMVEDGLSEVEAKNYMNVLKGSYNTKLKNAELVGLKQLYYEETHPKLSGPPKNESTGRSKAVMKKNPLLDGEASGKSWKGVGNIDMSTWDSIEANKQRKRDEAKLQGTEDKSKDLKGVRRVANGGKGKESKSTDMKVVKEKRVKIT